MLLLAAIVIGCGDCHPQVAAQWAASPMARSSGIVNAASEPVGEFLQESSHTRFAIARKPDQLELTWPGGRQSLDFYIGSGRAGRSYGFMENGYWYQAPVGYYSMRHEWDMAPGYEHDSAPDLSRPVAAQCLFCHASGVNPVSGTLNRYAQISDLRGVTCERCHGDGAKHAAHPRADNIINPARMSGSKRDSVCEQCHLSGVVRLELAHRNLRDFRPGDELSDFLAVFVAAAGGVRVNGHAEALSRSRCEQGSGGKLWCGTCHHLHGNESDYARVCATCHEPQQCPVAAKKGGDCITCHMPKSRAADGGHTAFTDHSIPRRPGSGADRRVPELRPYFVSPANTLARNLGLAYAEAGRRFNRPEWFEKAWRLLRQAAVEGPGDPALYTEIAALLDATGKVDEAVRYYRLSLELNGEQFDALVNLARLLERKGETRKAAELRERAAEMCPRCAANRGGGRTQ